MSSSPCHAVTNIIAAQHQQDAAARKKIAFDALYALDDENDEHEDEGLAESYQKVKDRTLGDPTTSLSRSRRTPGRTPGSFARSFSNMNLPLPQPKQQLQNPRRTKKPLELLEELSASSSVIKDTHTLQHHHTITGVPSLDNAMPPSSSAPPTSSAIPMVKNKKGKGKQVAEIKLVPEQQRIFQNLHFYFFPNSDTHPGRRQRIIRALEYGASWQSEFNDSVTHIITDREYDYAQLLKYLKLEELPAAMILVNENYPPSCMEFYKLVDPSSIEFRVKGYEMPAPVSVAQPQPASSQVSDVSLQLKPAKGRAAVLSSQLTTQPETNSDPISSAASQLASPALSSIIEDQAMNKDEDELDSAIREAKESHPLASDDEEEDGERHKRRKTNNWQDKFTCMHKHTGASGDQGPNAQTLSVLQELADYYDQTRDQWRSKSYRQAISALRKHPTKVTTKEEGMRVFGIGTSIAEKIEEIVRTSHLRKLDSTKMDERQQILNRFLKIYGVGLHAAERWVSAGYRTLDDLLQKAELNDNQRVGIAHYDDFNTRIPRAEVEIHAATVTKALKGLDKGYSIYTMGSYRRGAQTSGDIDLLITKPAASIDEIRTMIMDRLVPLLTQQGFLVAALAETSQADGTKWHGASCLPDSSIWRRIDLLLVPEEELGAALLYFTGNDIFNRSMRLLASKKGMRLNQRGLYKDVLRDHGREKLSEGTLVEGRDERKIFEALGVPWRPPEHRIC
ncbi:DNA polymerase beta-like protein [Aureobasidium sp. EXF-8845]|nr:DNA polymerase beta-like protein [Aureobasidium sp. EXF-8845]KAI4848027.1 DNA polymerase beta-like protein [Aureobasidium sp. EXF-8846]